MVGDKPDPRLRSPMQWNAGPGLGFTTGKAWERAQPDSLTTTVAAQDADASSLLNHYRALIRLRNGHVALTRGRLVMAPNVDAGDRATAAFVRSDPDETVFVVLNFGNRPVRDARYTLVSGNGESRMEPLYADPATSCTQARIIAAGTAVAIGEMAAHGLCVFQLVKL